VQRAVVLLLVAMAGVILGASLIGQWAVGLAVIADSVVLGLWALFADVPDAANADDLRASRERARQRARDAA
jgi:hypothetical protein